MPRQAKPAPWKVDSSADAVRFGRRKGSSKSSPAIAERPEGVPGESDPWGTT